MNTDLLIGLDDTDSKKGMCTTYLAALLVGLLKECAEIADYPLLVRLNPTIEYKTRGNAATAIKIKTSHADRVKSVGIGAVAQNAELNEENTNPGIVFAED